MLGATLAYIVIGILFYNFNTIAFGAFIYIRGIYFLAFGAYPSFWILRAPCISIEIVSLYCVFKAKSMNVIIRRIP